MRHLIKKCLVPLALVSSLVGGSATISWAAQGHSSSAQMSRNEATLRMEMRRLWQDHTLWTRMVIVSTALGSADLQANTERLLENQDEIGAAIKPFYGAAAGDRLTALLREHITGAATLLAAAKKNDMAKVEEARRAWTANADEIAAFLSQANPRHWPADMMKSMMREHLDITNDEATHQFKGEYALSVADYDRAQVQILKMADMLSDGIARQHPDRVRQMATR